MTKKRVNPVSLTATSTQKPLEPPARVEEHQPELRVQVTRAFSGAVIGEKIIYPGVYFLNDPRLFQQGTWLIEQGYAEWLE